MPTIFTREEIPRRARVKKTDRFLDRAAPVAIYSADIWIYLAEWRTNVRNYLLGEIIVSFSEGDKLFLAGCCR